MDTGYVILLYGAITTALATLAATVSPLLLSRMTAKQLAASKAQDDARQDKVAAKAEEAAALLLAANAEAARLLLEANAKTAKVAEKTAEVVGGKLDVIHTLVNSTLTGALEDQLLATEQLGVALREIVALHEAAGQSPPSVALSAVAANEAQASALHTRLADRAAQTAVADTQAAEPPQG